MLKSHDIGRGVVDPFGCSNLVLASANLLKRLRAHGELRMQSPRGSNRDPRERNKLFDRRLLQPLIAKPDALRLFPRASDECRGSVCTYAYVAMVAQAFIC